jgi:hypothetical protein
VIVLQGTCCKQVATRSYAELCRQSVQLLWARFWQISRLWGFLYLKSARAVPRAYFLWDKQRDVVIAWWVGCFPSIYLSLESFESDTKPLPPEILRQLWTCTPSQISGVYHPISRNYRAQCSYCSISLRRKHLLRDISTNEFLDTISLDILRL